MESHTKQVGEWLQPGKHLFRLSLAPYALTNSNRLLFYVRPVNGAFWVEKFKKWLFSMVFYQLLGFLTYIQQIKEKHSIYTRCLCQPGSVPEIRVSIRLHVNFNTHGPHSPIAYLSPGPPAMESSIFTAVVLP